MPELQSVEGFTRTFTSLADLMLTGSALIGIIVFLYGLFNIYRNAQNPGRFTIAQAIRSIIAGVLLLIPGSIYQIFKASTIDQGFSETGRSALALDSHLAQATQAGQETVMGMYIPQEMWTMILGFLFLVGMFSFLKGLFLVRSIGIQDDTGQLVSPKKVINHIFFGMVAMNITTVGQIAKTIFFAT